MTGHARVGALAMLVGFNSFRRLPSTASDPRLLGPLRRNLPWHGEGSPRTIVVVILSTDFARSTNNPPRANFMSPLFTLPLQTRRCAIIRFQVTQMLLARSHAEGRVIPLREVSAATGISISVLSSLASSRPGITTNTRFVESLCRYFRCQPGELLELSPSLADEPRHHIDELYPARGAHRAAPDEA